jgi:uncharacterized protein YjbJ (UPF0337 family)
VNRNRVAGSAKEAKGAIKEAIGNATVDSKLQVDGKADKAGGKFQNAIGGVQDILKN